MIYYFGVMWHSVFDDFFYMQHFPHQKRFILAYMLSVLCDHMICVNCDHEPCISMHTNYRTEMAFS